MSARPVPWDLSSAAIRAFMDMPMEHIILETCHTRGCENQAAWDDFYCPRCREEMIALGISQYYPRRGQQDV